MGRAFEYRRAAKEKRWDKMSKIFPKLARAITIAAKEGGPDPEANAKLRTAINNAKAENMPRDNVDKAIARASAQDAEVFVEANYEGKGPHGVLFWVECATDNPTRTVANVKVIFKKQGGEVVQSGSLDFLFERKTVIEFAAAEELDLEEVELSLIDAGLEEMEVIDGMVFASASFHDFGRMSAACEQLGIAGFKAQLKRVPTAPIEISEALMEEVEVLVDKLEEDDDVQAVFTNVA
jgi:YebC/PmpR family DNA-binding regulatory protein